MDEFKFAVGDIVSDRETPGAEYEIFDRKKDQGYSGSINRYTMKSIKGYSGGDFDHEAGEVFYNQDEDLHTLIRRAGEAAPEDEIDIEGHLAGLDTGRLEVIQRYVAQLIEKKSVDYITAGEVKVTDEIFATRFGEDTFYELSSLKHNKTYVGGEPKVNVIGYDKNGEVLFSLTSDTPIRVKKRV